MPDHSLPAISLADYHYDLPAERIAEQPLSQRDQSKLLVYQQGEIIHQQFFQVPERLPKGSLLVLNDTRVIPARLILYRATGARIELLLLKPVAPREVHKAMAAKSYVSWECMIGNKKKWKDGEVLSQAISVEGRQVYLNARLIDRERQWVELSWEDADLSFAELIGYSGNIPLPPYIKREANEADKEQYQTVYSRNNGAVAAPTAGLHFTPEVLEALQEKGIEKEYVTLHVSAGTFQPIKQDDVMAHDMHAEQLIISQQNLERLINHWPEIVAVGTTSMRVLESLYWFGVQVLQSPSGLSSSHYFRLDQFFPYQQEEAELPSTPEALEALREHLVKHGLESISAETSIFIFPSYTFRLCKGLITNFHLPETTLILLVAAFIGEDWRKVYQAALDEGYRFLSYGDSSLLLP